MGTAAVWPEGATCPAGSSCLTPLATTRIPVFCSARFMRASPTTSRLPRRTAPGCSRWVAGPATSLRLASRKGLDVTGLDLDPAMIERALGAFSQVRTPVGPVDARFVYRPASFAWGAAISVLAIAAAAAFAALRLRARWIIA